MNINILIICITVIIGLLIVSATALSCFEKHAETHKPRSFAEILGGLPIHAKQEERDEDE